MQRRALKHPNLSNTVRLTRNTGIGIAIITLLSACSTLDSTFDPGYRYPSARVDDRSIQKQPPTTTENQTQTQGDQATPWPNESFARSQANAQAEYYAKAATKTSQSEKGNTLLNAAENYIQAGDHHSARGILSQLPAELSTEQRLRVSVVQSYIDYAQGDYNKALNQLTALLANDLTPNQQRVDALLLSAFCYQETNNTPAAVTALLERETLLTGPARAENIRYTNQIIGTLSAQQQRVLSDNNPQFRNRLIQTSSQTTTQLPTQPSIHTQQPDQFVKWRDQTGTTNPAVTPQWSVTSPKRVAILLPLSSRFAKPAQAVLDGINYQHNNNHSTHRPEIITYDIGNDPLQTGLYYQSALQNGADTVIGPLGLQYAEQLQNQGYRSNATTILLGGQSPLSGTNTIRFSLSPESEGQQLAQRAYQLGYVNAAILATESAQHQRIAHAFAQSWSQHGGHIASNVNYYPTQYDHSTEIKRLFDIQKSEYRHRQLSTVLGYKPKFQSHRRNDIDVIIMLSDDKTGRILRPQINFFNGDQLPVLAPASLYNGTPNPVDNMDLDKTQFPVMPWLLQSSLSESSNQAQHPSQLSALFAMGMDAYNLAGSYYELRNNTNHAIQGTTGDLQIQTNGIVSRQPVWSQFVKGVIQPMQAIDLTAIRKTETLPSTPHSERKHYNDSTWDSRNHRRKSSF